MLIEVAVEKSNENVIDIHIMYVRCFFCYIIRAITSSEKNESLVFERSEMNVAARVNYVHTAMHPSFCHTRKARSPESIKHLDTSIYIVLTIVGMYVAAERSSAPLAADAAHYLACSPTLKVKP